MRSALLAVLALAACACTGGASDPTGETDGAAGATGEAGASAGTASVEVGVPGGADGLDFEPLAPESELPLRTFGQGGTHVLVGVRCLGFGARAFVSATLRNLTTDVEVAEPAPARPQLLFCDDQGICDLVPYLVHASGLTETDAERDGLPVLVTVRVRNDAGVDAEGSVQVVLNAAGL